MLLPRGCYPASWAVWLVVLATQGVLAETPQTQPAASDKRPAVPSAAEQAKSERLIHQLFADDYAKKSASDRHALARKLLENAGGMQDDPAGRYVLLRDARDAAVGTGDFATALAAIDVMKAAFDVDAGQLKVAALLAVQRAAPTATLGPEFAQACLDLAHEEFEAGDFDGSLRLAELTENWCRRAKETEMAGDARILAAEARRLAGAAVRYPRHSEDRAASTAMGTYLCFVRGEWAKGLPLLARGSDAKLATAASRELASPTKPDDQFDLANVWWDEATALPSLYRNGIEARAVEWYRRAMPGLKSLSKAIAEKRAGAHPVVAHGQGAPTVPPVPADAPPQPGGQVSLTNSLGIRMLLIPLNPKGFEMGSPENETGHAANEKLHHVKLTRPYMMATTLVTKGQFTQFVKATGFLTGIEKLPGQHPDWQHLGFPQGDDHPVVGVAYDDALAFCKWLSEKERRSYRMPTEAEWEYAARAGTQTAYPWGDNPDDGKAYANCADGSSRLAVNLQDYFNYTDGFANTSPVAAFKANAFELYDMIGNASEWCSDFYDVYPGTSAVDPKGAPVGDSKWTRVLRGGSWADGTERSRVAFRRPAASLLAGPNIGFRLCLDPPAELLAAAKLPPRTDAQPGKEPARRLKGALVNSLGMTMVPIPLDPGGFEMGSPQSETGRWKNETLHRVRLTHPFMMATTPVTVAQFSQFATETGYMTSAEMVEYSLKEGRMKLEDLDPRIQYLPREKGGVFGINWRIAGIEQQDNHPVVMMSPKDAEAFCAWLSQKEGRHYRLPTEAEWEYAARAGTKTVYFWGNDPDGEKEYGNCADIASRQKFPAMQDTFNVDDGFPFTSPVGAFKPNAYGLYDMIGNAAQWCSDISGAYPNGEVVDPQGPPHTPRKPDDEIRVARGGGWDSGPATSRVALRFMQPAINPTNHSGFRLCLDPPGRN